MNNKMDGIGLFKSADSRKYYFGEYSEDQKHGYGIFQIEDGRIHTGYWKKGEVHGLGILKLNE